MHEFERVLARADLVHPAEAVDAAFERLGAEVSARLGDRNPVVLAVMLGGLVPAGRLIPLLDFAIEIDYVHATRYERGTRGRTLTWLARPRTPLAGRTVLVVDDILDEGVTLAAILEYCRGEGAAEALGAVLVDKRHGRARAVERADFTGLDVDDRYVFGCGMDYRGYFRNLPAIYAIDEEGESG